jgi:hypothetical protein
VDWVVVDLTGTYLAPVIEQTLYTPSPYVNIHADRPEPFAMTDSLPQTRSLTVGALLLAVGIAAGGYR